MARSSDPNSAGSQFFICVADAPHLNGKYTAFGEVIENMFVADHLVNAMTDSRQAKLLGEESIPKGEDPQKMDKVTNSSDKKITLLQGTRK